MKQQDRLAIQSKDPNISPVTLLRLPRRFWKRKHHEGLKPHFLTIYPLPPSGKGQAPVFDVFEAFLNTDNIQVFANAATSYIMCLMKFVKGLGKWNSPLVTLTVMVDLFTHDFVQTSLEAGCKSKRASWDMGTWVQRLPAL